MLGLQSSRPALVVPLRGDTAIAFNRNTAAVRHSHASLARVKKRFVVGLFDLGTVQGLGLRHRGSQLSPHALPPPSLESVTDLATLRIDPQWLWSSIVQRVEQINLPVQYIEIVIAAIAGYAAGVWPNRPRGWCRKDLLEVKSSSVQGRGIFARKYIPERTILGAYPGRLRSAHDMATKIESAPLSGQYCFRNKHNQLLDPTDWSGQPSSTPSPGLPWLPIDPMLSYANEPPKGSTGVNVTVEDDPNDDYGLVFVTTRAISEGAEIFVDYGVNYDRSTYLSREDERNPNIRT
jgi:hypothetical protein